MSFNFPLILLSLIVFTAMVCLVDFIWQRIQPRSSSSLPLLVDYSRSFLPILVIVFLLRSFVIQPYRVPTGSLEPTIMPGDFILVKQYQYGLFMPVWHAKLLSVSEPKRGQIALFHDPVNPSLNLVKRVVGVPGDDISYVNKVFTINGKVMTQKFVRDGYDVEPGQADTPVKVVQENLMGVKHDILINPARPAKDFYHLKVPQGYYMMVGDNRDNSDDSRYWGFVPEKNFIGQAFLVWMSWNVNAPWSDKIRWHRIGNRFYS